MLDAMSQVVQKESLVVQKESLVVQAMHAIATHQTKHLTEVRFKISCSI